VRCYILSREDNLSQVLYTAKRRQLTLVKWNMITYLTSCCYLALKIHWNYCIYYIDFLSVVVTSSIIFISHKPYTTEQRRHTYTIRMLVLGPTEPFNTFIYLVIKKDRVRIILTKMKPVTFLCFSQVWTWISTDKRIGLFCILEWVKVKSSCWFCRYWWNSWQSLFRMSISDT
jgi:hypothetical protein